MDTPRTNVQSVVRVRRLFFNGILNFFLLLAYVNSFVKFNLRAPERHTLRVCRNQCESLSRANQWAHWFDTRACALIMLPGAKLTRERCAGTDWPSSPTVNRESFLIVSHRFSRVLSRSINSFFYGRVVCISYGYEHIHIFEIYIYIYSDWQHYRTHKRTARGTQSHTDRRHTNAT